MWGGIYSIMVIIIGNRHIDQVQILDISLSANTLEKSVNPTILLPTMDKL